MSFSGPTGVTAPQANISGYKVKNVPNFTPEQMKLFSRLLGDVQGGSEGIGRGIKNLSGLAGGGNEGQFEELEAPAFRDFNKLLGQIGSRYAGLGALDSSSFQNATSGAAGELSENLQSQRMGIQNNSLDRLLELSERLLGSKPYDTFLEPKKKKFDWGSLLGGLGGGALGAIGGGSKSLLKLLGMG